LSPGDTIIGGILLSLWAGSYDASLDGPKKSPRRIRIIAILSFCLIKSVNATLGRVSIDSAMYWMARVDESLTLESIHSFTVFT
jgi:hypothetical protein